MINFSIFFFKNIFKFLGEGFLIRNELLTLRTSHLWSLKKFQIDLIFQNFRKYFLKIFSDFFQGFVFFNRKLNSVSWGFPENFRNIGNYHIFHDFSVRIFVKTFFKIYFRIFLKYQTELIFLSDLNRDIPHTCAIFGALGAHTNMQFPWFNAKWIA